MISFKEAVEFLSLLNKNKVKYLIIGGVAVNIHGYTRATGDLDIWYKPSNENFDQLIKSIQDFGFDISPIGKLEHYELKGFIRLPLDPFFTELLSAIDGKLDFDRAYIRSFNLILMEYLFL
jgi:hypothetical protein